MGVLHVVHRVVLGLRLGQVDVEHEFAVGLARGEEKACCIPPDFIDQVAQRDIRAGALGDLHFFAAAHHRHHLVQNIVGVAGRDAASDRHQSGAHPRDGAVMVRALDVDGALEAAFPFGDVIGHIRHEVSPATLGLAHHAVLVIAIVGAAQPQRAFGFIGLAGGGQRLHRGLDPAIAVQRGFEVVVVKAHTEGLQVQILFAAQAGHGKAADGLQVIDIATGGDGCHLVIADTLLGQIGLRDIADVIAAIAIGRPFRRLGRQSARARLHR